MAAPCRARPSDLRNMTAYRPPRRLLPTDTSDTSVTSRRDALRLTAAGLLGLALAPLMRPANAAYNIWTGEYTMTRQDIEAAVGKRFPTTLNYGQLLSVELTHPKIGFNPQANRVITQIDIRETLKRKVNADFRPYTILGACNPALALEALKLEDKVGTMLPCNVIVQELRLGEVEIAAVDPVASMQAIQNRELADKAQTVRGKLEKVIRASDSGISAPSASRAKAFGVLWKGRETAP